VRPVVDRLGIQCEMPLPAMTCMARWGSKVTTLVADMCDMYLLTSCCNNHLAVPILSTSRCHAEIDNGAISTIRCYAV
jgi:hypothetical protein